MRELYIFNEEVANFQLSMLNNGIVPTSGITGTTAILKMGRGGIGGRA